MKVAVPMAAETRQDIDEFTEGLKEEYQDQVKKWDAMLTAWNNNPSEAPNPFEPTQKGATIN